MSLQNEIEAASNAGDHKKVLELKARLGHKGAQERLKEQEKGEAKPARRTGTSRTT